jgi:imidazolonepropionase
MDIVSTFMGAHAIPSEYKENKEGYLVLLKKMLQEVKNADLAHYCDVFCEEGVFSIEDSRQLLVEAKHLGYKLKIHADEIVPLGGASLAAELGCVSADHLMASTEEDMDRLAKHHIVANLLPSTSFYLGKEFAKARTMIEHHCGLAISTDYNPGSSPSENIQLAMQIASLKMKLTPKEVLTAVTINAACGIEQQHRIGSIEVGKQADFILFNVPNLEYLFYHFGINHVKDVYKNGICVVKDQHLIYKETN